MVDDIISTASFKSNEVEELIEKEVKTKRRKPTKKLKFKNKLIKINEAWDKEIRNFVKSGGNEVDGSPYTASVASYISEAIKLKMKQDGILPS